MFSGIMRFHKLDKVDAVALHWIALILSLHPSVQRAGRSFTFTLCLFFYKVHLVSIFFSASGADTSVDVLSITSIISITLVFYHLYKICDANSTHKLI